MIREYYDSIKDVLKLNDRELVSIDKSYLFCRIHPWWIKGGDKILKSYRKSLYNKLSKKLFRLTHYEQYTGIWRLDLTVEDIKYLNNYIGLDDGGLCTFKMSDKTINKLIKDQQKVINNSLSTKSKYYIELKLLLNKYRLVKFSKSNESDFIGKIIDILRCSINE